ncbi:MAG: peptidoglycan DD-metalloendopeptidase family protein [Bacteroidales bacterium]|nr:peptidoglycan DD-metalloendopeptidase family protein [Bacteroidales bacterium]
MSNNIDKPKTQTKTPWQLVSMIGGAFGLIGLILLIISGIQNNKKSENASNETCTEEDPATYFLSIRTDTLHMEEGRVKNGASLSSILSSYGISMATIDKTARISKPVFDVRRLVSGHQYIALCTQDSLPRLKYFLYRENMTDYVIFDYADSIRVYREQKEITCRQQSCQGVIESSLWQTLHDNGDNIELSFSLSDIYAWQIDFFAIQAGDYFKVIYDEYFVDDTVSVGIGDIHVAQFNHFGKDYFAIPFSQDGFKDYFDDKGMNLRRAFLKAPLKYSRISSKFSHGRMHPILRIRRPHHGVDYAAPTGTPVMSIGAGVVTKKAYQKNGGGNYVTIKHNGTYTTTYMHLHGFAKGLEVGKKVSQGEVIGYVGSTGLSSGPHLDFRVYMNGQAIDPLKIESPPSVPLKECHRDSFMLIKDSLIQCISKIS